MTNRKRMNNDNKPQQKNRLGTVNNKLLGAKTGFTLQLPSI